MKRFAKFFLPVLAAILIDLISEILKAFGRFAAREITLSKLLGKMDWQGLLMLVALTSVVSVALYFVMKVFAEYESESLGARIAILVATLMLIGSTNVWGVLLNRSEMRKMYDELTEHQSSVDDVEKKASADWNMTVYFHRKDDSLICKGECSFAFLFSVPDYFGETLMELDFDANKKLLKKDWL